MTHPNSSTLQITPTGTRGSKAKVSSEEVQVLDPTPAVANEDAPTTFDIRNAVHGDVVGSAVRPLTPAQETAQKEAEAAVQYFRYTGNERRIRMTEKNPLPGMPASSYQVTIRPGKIFSSKEYNLEVLKNQGIREGANLERISEEEARTN